MPARTALTLALPLLLSGCLALLDDQDRELLVVNNTASAIIVDVDVKAGSWYDNDDEDHEVVYPAGVFSEKYPGAAEVEVRVIRASDGALLFSADYDADDFEDEDGEIVITVNP
jgi:hypothetical protein